MEIGKHFQPRVRCTFSDNAGGVYITVPAAVAVSLRIERVVPDAHAYIVDTGLLQRIEQIVLAAVPAIEFHTGFFERNYT